MYHKLTNIFILLVMPIMFISCRDEIDLDANLCPDLPGTLTIRFNNSEGTRSSDSDKSEIFIGKISIGLYPLSDDETMQAKAWKTQIVNSTTGSATATLQLTDEMVQDLFSKVDGAKCRFFVLANVDNVPEFASIETMKNLAVSSKFDSKKLQDSFVMAGAGMATYTAPANPSVKGKAAGTTDLIRAAAKIRLNISLPNEIEIKDDDNNVIERWHPVTNTTDGIRVLLNNGVKSAVTSPANDDKTPWTPYIDDETDPYYNSSLGTTASVRTLTQNGTGTYNFVMDVPFYSYPNSWTESIEEKYKTTMTLIVPWQKNNESQYSTFYYEVPVTAPELTHIDRNNEYTVNLKVGMLGSLVPDVPILVADKDISYQVLNWSTQNLDISINDYRYLVVNPNVLTFNNESELRIPYYTSHPVKVVNLNISYQRFAFVSEESNPEVGKVVSFNIDEDQIKATNLKYPSTPICTRTLEETADQKYLKIHHPLNLWTPCKADGTEISLTGYSSVADTINVIKDINYYKPETDDAFSRYVITCTIQHEDKPEYKEDIIIYQYPAIYITADPNPASKPEGNVFVNTYTNKRAKDAKNNVPTFGSTTGIGAETDAKNRNPNMYVINITSLSSDITFSVEDEETGKTSTYNYIIGDPRSKFWTCRFSTTVLKEETVTYEDGEGNTVTTKYQQWSDQKTRTSNSEPTTDSWCWPAQALYPNSNKRTLTYYYITLEDGTVTNMISPQFRIASSWGVTSSISRVYARYRAALYQENAYPAGRWRIPTVAEFSFINKLSMDKKIPKLFTVNTPYWTSEGLYKGTADGKIVRIANQCQNRAVRAVYDEWYWSQYPQYSIYPDGDGNYSYTLGDVPRGQ